jgi:hypothetical protein
MIGKPLPTIAWQTSSVQVDSVQVTGKPEAESQLAMTGVAVEKLSSRKSAGIKSRQDALQTICRGRLDIFYAPICSGFLRFRVFQHPQSVWSDRPAALIVG